MKKRIFTVLAWTLTPLLIASGVYALDGSGWEGSGNTASPTFTGNVTLYNGYLSFPAGQTMRTGSYQSTYTTPTIYGSFFANSVIAPATKNVVFNYYGKPAIHAAGQVIGVYNALPDLSNNHTGGSFNVVHGEALVSADANITKNVIRVETGWDNIVSSANFSVAATGNLESAGTGTFATGGSTNHTVCWKAGGLLGYCSSVVAADGTCTCN